MMRCNGFKKFGVFVLAFFVFLPFNNQAQQKPGQPVDPVASRLRLWYDKPAKQWEETLPLGNGRLGMMPDGGVVEENIVLNDITLWSGAPQDANNYAAYKKLPEIQQLLLDGKNDQAQALIDKDFICTGKGSGAEPFGCFQTLGKLSIQYRYGNSNAAQERGLYIRTLFLNHAIARTEFKLDGVKYERDYFTSFSDDVGIIRIKADKRRAISLAVGLSREEKGTVTTINNTLEMYGQLDNGTDGKGMEYLAAIGIRQSGGRLRSLDNKLLVDSADEVLIYISNKTSFKDHDFRQQARRLLTRALAGNYKVQFDKHWRQYRQLFARTSIYLGPGPRYEMPTNKRLEKFYNATTPDNDLTVLFYQFSRYLTISSTRVGLLPPNLQGLWAHQIRTPWNGDYHLDVNVQMNHWGVEPGNLSELNLPLAELVSSLVPHGEKTAKAYYNADGWIAHVITNPWMFTEPGESASWGVSKSGSGWLCNNLWDHYAFTHDKNYLKKIYPVLKGSAQFYAAILIKDPKTGYMVTSPSSSPENSFFMPDGSGKHVSICMGATIDNQIIRELFTNVIEAANTLGIDADFRDQLVAKLVQIPPAGRIAPDGRLMEWLENYQETDKEHRHISHLYGLYPANLITPSQTPALADACRKSLNVRGDDGPSWAIAYKQLFWARLHDGNRAYKLFREIMKPTRKTDINYGAGGGVYPNLLSAGPPFQIDGNFGAGAGIAEMLLQSHEGFINLIPAIPDAWKPEGFVKGMKARGNITVSFAWKAGKVTSYSLTSPVAQIVPVKVNGQLLTVKTKQSTNL
ncbi:glycoside hydrolase family 95 protein [Paraflavitalea sp. CAU 1676]|uniref:glycoside hydrolase family 95 protein n=1 Tax=Paraflavitalea sp. CAU 1676 TaxID=3032598 RepID=UPI0023DCB569|nr:glycoside hydrolase family 95 protein [Paraflavitalea sp. CAU 1676]MDF2188277.1 glycoside hydrolase family 95 protein [Paraflavitalea sp. CAU 1676]